MSSGESESDKIYNIVIVSFKKAIENEVPFLSFEELRDHVATILETKVGTREIREAIGALRNDGKIKSRKIAGRDIYYLVDMITVYKDFISNK
jgi:hypothetical protein